MLYNRCCRVYSRMSSETREVTWYLTLLTIGIDPVSGLQQVGASGHAVSPLSVRDFDKYQRHIPRAGVATTGWSRENEATPTCFFGAVQVASVSVLVWISIALCCKSGTWHPFHCVETRCGANEPDLSNIPQSQCSPYFNRIWKHASEGKRFKILIWR